jgi:prepilin-type N-terminal cleavage/methylation domain-containing protein
MLPVDAPALERNPMKSRRGVTLVELLVAMALAGIVASMVAGWIVHVGKRSVASQRRDDREQELSMLRNELFQDGTRGRTLELGRSSWKIAREHPGTEPDTVEWSIGPNGLRRNGVQKLSSDTVLDGSMAPHATGLRTDWDAWTQLDRNFDNLVDPEHLGILDRFELSFRIHRRATPGAASEEDTVRIVVPLLGPG